MTNWMERAPLAIAATSPILGLCFPAVEAQNPGGAGGQKPNVVFILADNVGYGGMGPYGGGELRGSSPSGTSAAVRRACLADMASSAIGLQANCILLAKDVLLLFKYYDEISAKARPEGRRFVFGRSWTLKIPKAKPAPKK